MTRPRSSERDLSSGDFAGLQDEHDEDEDDEDDEDDEYEDADVALQKERERKKAKIPAPRTAIGTRTEALLVERRHRRRGRR